MVEKKERDPLEEKFEMLARCCMDFKDAVCAVTEGISDDEVLRLAALASKNSHPGEDVFSRGSSKNFSIPLWEEVAKTLRFEIAMRQVQHEAVAYMERTGKTSYCLRCRGECTPEHLAELRDD